MDEDDWVEREYQALRAEILALGEAERDAVKFYVPLAALVYVVPYYILTNWRLPTPAHHAYLWSLAAGVVGLMLLAMMRSILWSVDGSGRVGIYIMSVIEPRTRGGLRYESILFELQQKQKVRASDVFMVAVACVLANIAAAFGASYSFLSGRARWLPVAVALALLAFTLPSLLSIASESRKRVKYVEDLQEAMQLYAGRRTTQPNSHAPR